MRLFCRGSLLVLALAVPGVAAAQPPEPTMKAAEATAETKPKQPQADEAKRCVRETHVGTHIGKMVCRTASERAADIRAEAAVVEASKEAVRQFTGELLSVPSFTLAP
jgi:hypothetical protein